MFAGLAESGLGSGLQINFSRKNIENGVSVIYESFAFEKKSFIKPSVDIRVRRFESGARLQTM